MLRALRIRPTKIRYGDMDIYDIWIDGENKCHLISEMETSHINGCIRNIRRAADSWRYDNFETLNGADKKEIHIPLKRAWFVVNAHSYLCRFRTELINRYEDTLSVDKAINYIEAAQSNS
jgi:hypothetical protein